MWLCDRCTRALGTLALALGALLPILALAALAPASSAQAPSPSSVTIAGSFQSELGCPGDWQPECAATHLTFDAADGVWRGAFNVPVGSWEYKAALNDNWTENYGRNAQLNGANIPLTLATASSVKFYYDPVTHWVTDNRSARIVTAAGSFQSELGCPGDWQPDCLRSWLQDADGDGTYTMTTTAIPAGSYEVKAAINESWDENYGVGGVAGGANIPFTVPTAGSAVTFTFVSSTNTLTVTVTAVGTEQGGVEGGVTLGASPNPFRSATRVRFGLPAAADAELVVFDALGRVVARLAEGRHAAGWHEAALEAGVLPAGVYVARLSVAGEAPRTQRLTLLR